MHTPVYIRSHSWQYITEQKPRHEVKGTACRAQRRDDAQIWGRLQKKFCSLKVPKSTVACIILKGKKFGTTRILSNQGRSALDKWGDKKPMVNLAELQRFCVEMGETSRRTNITATLHWFGLYGRMARWKPLFIERHMKACLQKSTKGTLWRDLKMAVHRRSPSNLRELERICREEWQKIPKSRWAKLVASYLRRLKAVIAAKGAE